MAKSRYLPDPMSPWLIYLMFPVGIFCGGDDRELDRHEGRLDARTVTAVATSSTIGRRAYIILTSGKKLVVRNFKGFERFLADLVEENPDIAVDPANLEPWLPRVPGGGGRYLNQETNNRWK